jgi:hypothetical protein
VSLNATSGPFSGIDDAQPLPRVKAEPIQEGATSIRRAESHAAPARERRVPPYD